MGHGYKGTKGKIIDFLGNGLSAEVVASAVGVTTGYISQLLSDPEIAQTVSGLRSAKLSEGSDRDSKYDDLEDSLLDQLEEVVPFMTKSHEIVRALTMVNGAKRRTVIPEVTDSISGAGTVINLILPTAMVPQFITNANNQVVEAGDQTLVTMPSGQLEVMHNEHSEDRKGEHSEHSEKQNLKSRNSRISLRDII